MRRRTLVTMMVASTLLAAGCGKDAAEKAKDAVKTVGEGGPSLGSATAIEFVSDVSWLKDYFSSLDQASIPWIWGTFLFTQEIAEVSGIPVLFDAAKPPEVKADVLIQAAGSSIRGEGGKPVTVFDGKDVPLKLVQLTAMIKIGDDSTEYDKIPESVPYVGGKTVYPWYFLVTLNEYAWSEAGEDTKKGFKDAIDSGNLAGQKDNAPANLPVPWLDCETVKITVKYKGTGEGDKYQIEATKYLAADPKVTLKLLGQLADGAGPIIEEQTGYDIAKLKDALNSVDAPDCEAPDDADKALFK